METYLQDLIRDVVYRERGNNWQGRFLPLVASLRRLEPNVPEDGTTQYIAFNADEKRMKLKTARFLTRKLGLNSGFLTDKQIMGLAETINRRYFPDIEIRLDTGKQITDNYRRAVGGHSCMTGNNSRCTKLYEMNPTRFAQLVMFCGNNSARAIVHTLDNGRKLMDRVYSDSESLKDRMEQYADSQNWARRGRCGCTIIGENYEDCIVSNLAWEEGGVPYADCLTDYKIESTGNLTIFHYKADLTADGSLDNTDGYLNECRRPCDNCGESLYDEDAYALDNGDRYCSYCFNEHYFYCGRCDETTHNDDRVFIEDEQIDVCEYCADRHYYRCEDCDNWFRDVTEIDGGNCVCESCLDNYSQCDDCGAYYLPEETTPTEDGIFCKNCAEEHAEAHAESEII